MCHNAPGLSPSWTRVKVSSQQPDSSMASMAAVHSNNTTTHSVKDDKTMLQ